MRFKGFEEEWTKKRLDELFAISAGGDIPSNHVSQTFTEVFKYPIYANAEKDKGLYGYSDVYKAEENVVTIAGRGANLGIAHARNHKFYPIVRLLVLKPKSNYDIIFFEHQINQLNLFIESTGVPQLTVPQVSAYYVSFPSISEQSKIATLLTLIDERISTQSKIIEGLKSLKVRLRQHLLQEIVRGEKNLSVKDVLDYEQPTKHIVTNTNYLENTSSIPVLTANKAFVLGYTDEKFGVYDKGECIIFDDFTMDMKYVDFSFKVKSSAIKILTAKPEVNLKFMFEYFSFLNFTSSEHKRHYISEIEPMMLSIPERDKQDYIGECLSSIDVKVRIESKIHALLTKQKQHLLHNMFI